MSYVNRSSVMGVGVTFVVTSIAAVALRFSLRMRHKMGLGADDYLSLAAMVLVIAASSICIAGSATSTIGAHSPDIGLGIFTYVNGTQQLQKKLEYAFYAVMILALVCLKLSVLFFYRRIFKINRTFVICFWILFCSTVAWGVAFFIAWVARCGNHPENGWYSLESLTEKCVNSFDVLVSQAVFDVVVDLGILALPIPFVLQLAMSTSQKLAVLGVLLVGSLSMGCGIARMIIVGWILGTPLFQDARIAGESSTDFMGIVSLMIFWGMLELGVGMIAICLPTMRPMFKGVRMQSMMDSLRSFTTKIPLISPKASRASRASSKNASFSGKSDHSDNHGQGIEKRMDYEVHSTSSV